MRSTTRDQDHVWSRLQGSDELNPYRLVYRDPDRLVYKLADSKAWTP
jgi:hypothetical protein